MSSATGALDARDLLFAVDLANVVREAMEGKRVEELPYITSEPNNASNCVLANAFNFDCRVSYHEHEPYDYGDVLPPLAERDNYPLIGTGNDHVNTGYVAFFEHKAAEALAGELNVPVFRSGEYYAVPLPDDVTRIALAFDNDPRNELDDLLTEVGWTDQVFGSGDDADYEGDIPSRVG